MIELPNNRLILNGHKIFNKDQLIGYINKRLNLSQPINNIEDLDQYLDTHISIAIRHGGSFLAEEEDKEKNHILNFLQQHRNMKMS